MSVACLEVNAVSYQAGRRQLLAQVSLDVKPGEIVALVGPNGAGKSTLLRIMAGDLTPSAGAVLLDGQSISTFNARGLSLRRAVLPQQTVLQFAFTAREVVLMGRSPHGARGVSPTSHLEAADLAMCRTDTGHLAGRIFPTLSGGEQGRVTLARVLAQETPILLLDEPTASLDIHHQELVMDVAQGLAARGAAVLAVLHDLNLAATYADRVAMLSRGRLVALGDPASVLTAQLLSSVFEHPIAVTAHPFRDCPLVLPLPADAGRDDRAAGARAYDLVRG